MDTHKAEVIEEFEHYSLIQYKKKKKYICTKCTDNINQPKKTFSQEKHIIRHLQDKHGVNSSM